MSPHLMEQLSPYSEWLSFAWAGIMDAFDPCGLTVLLFFVAFFTFRACPRFSITVGGAFFVGSFFLTTLFLQFGYFEGFRQLEMFSLMARVVFMFLGVLSVGLGVLNLADWWNYLKTKNPDDVRLKMPLYRANLSSMPVQGHVYFVTLRLMFAAILGGFMASLLKSIWFGKIYFPHFSTILGATGQRQMVAAGIILYTITTVLPLLFLFLWMLKRSRLNQWVGMGERNFSKIKIIFSAMFLGVGFGLLFAFTRISQG